MGDVNPICTLGDYSIPSHEGYRNTIEIPVGNNVLPFRSGTIRLVKNGCSFHRLRSEDPNQHLKDFHLTLTVKTGKERSITTWDDLTTLFFAQVFPPGRTTKLCNDILMFQQHQGESLSKAWTRFKDLLQKVPHHGIDLWLQVQIFYDHVNPVTRQTIDQSAGGKLHDRNAEESWALLKDLVLYDNKSWNDPRDFAKSVKEISLPQDVPSRSDCRLIELENQYCVEDLEQAFVEYASSGTDEAEVLKAITDRLAGSLPSDTVKNPKLSTSLVFSARSYPTIDPPMIITPLHFNQRHQNMFHGGEHFPDKPAANKDGDWTQKPEEPEPTLKDEFQDLHLNLPVLKT
nr:hypothetical protein [Tanacetum cinerariifolium]